MNKLDYYSKCEGGVVKGFTLIELLVVMAIVGLLLLVGGMNFYETKNRNDVLNCAKRMASDIKMARRWSQGSGGRIVFMTSFNPNLDEDQGFVDLDGVVDPSTNQQYDEFYIIFQDSLALGGFENAVSTPIVLSGTRGDPLCDEQIMFRKESTFSSNGISVVRGVGSLSPQGMLFFSSQGTLLNFGSADKNLYLEKNGQVVRLQVVGLTGGTRIYVNQPGYIDCGGGTCTTGTTDSNGYNSNWQPIQQTL